MVQKAVAAYGVDQLLALALPSGGEHGAQVGRLFLVAAALGIHRGKGSEVMPADYDGSRYIHGVLLQRIGVVIDVAGQKGRTDGLAPDAVTIGLGLGGGAGVKVSPGFLDG